MRAKIFISLFVITLACSAFISRPSRSGRAPSVATVSADSLSLPDSLPLADSLRPDSARLRAALPDSLRLSAADTLGQDSLQADTAKKKKDSGLDAPVKYTATDSMVYDANTSLAYLYGESQVNYQDMQLTAAEIAMSLDSSLVHANGRADTSGRKVGEPVYTQGADKYESELMTFNFKTKKGYINNVYTTQGNGYLQSEDSKRASDGTLYLQHAKYTTCDAKHPHFYLALSRAKVRPGKEAFFGPAHLVVADVPLPIGVPYGFFPFNKKYSSGFIMPSYGDETVRGFYLRDGGYYFAINDYFDLKALGEIYTKGSWGLSGETNYRKRYRFSGNFYVSFIKTVEGEKNMPDYSVQNSLKVQWTHTMDAKAAPNTSFSARVNFASQSYERNNLDSRYDPLSYTQSTRASSVSFSHTFSRIGLSIAASANLTQSMRGSSVSVTLPDLSINLARVYPFKRKKQVGNERWYEKISFTYTGQLSNSITTQEGKLFHSNLIKDWRNGMKHSIPVSATFNLFKYINVTPSFSFTDRMYTNKLRKSWDRNEQKEKTDTIYGFYNVYDWNTSLQANTTLYGMFKPLPKLFGGKIIAVRHVFKPSVSFNYAPDFTQSRYGYRKSYVKTDAEGNVSTVYYSPYQNALYGYPSSTMQGRVDMSISNNLEMKVKSKSDSTGERKISLIDEFSANLSYNFADKVRPWSDLTTNIRLKLTKNYTLSLAAQFATYAYKFDENGNIVESDRTEWSYGRFGRFQGMSQNLSYTFNNQTFKKLWNWITGKKDDETQAEVNAANAAEDAASGDDLEEANVDPDIKAAREGGAKQKVKAKVDDDGYLAFSIPWSLSVSYGVTMSENRDRSKFNVRRMRYPYALTQTLNFSGFIRIADGWNISFSSGYDFNYHELSMTTASLQRDLHCFSMSASIVLRPYSSFNFTFQARASELADALRWEKRSSYSSNVEWY